MIRTCHLWLVPMLSLLWLVSSASAQWSPPVLIAPSGSISTATPTYRWLPVAGATWYQLWVNDSTGTRVNGWYTAAAVNAASGECSITPAESLAPGSATWWVRAWNSQVGNGPWSAGMSFGVSTSLSPPVLLSPSGSISTATPTYRWSPVPGATWYQLWVNDSTGNLIQRWYPAAAVNAASGECSITPGESLAPGSATWWVRAWNSQVGNGSWSAGMSFGVSTSLSPPVLLSPSGSISTATPTYRWSPVPGATWYQLWVNDSTGNPIQRWYPAAAVNAASGECSITPGESLAPGSATWWVRAWNPLVGNGSWSAGMSFSVLPQAPCSGEFAWLPWLPGLGSFVLPGPVYALTAFDDGAGSALYAGGIWYGGIGVFEHVVARWDGTAWIRVGGEMDGQVWALTVFDDGTGPALYAGGDFTTAGGVPVNGIARWNGTAWSPLGSGVNGFVLALTVFDDGAGPALYAGGGFLAPGGFDFLSIVRWNGTAWSAPESGMNQLDLVTALTVFDDGTGPALYAGSLRAGREKDEVEDFVARWDGTAWTQLGGVMDGIVLDLTVFDDGTGPALYAAGIFDTAGDVAVTNGIARWDGTAWRSLGGEMEGSASALTVFDDGSGPALYAGGFFVIGEEDAPSGVAKRVCID